MKKFIALLLALGMTTSMVACGGYDEETESGAEGGNSNIENVYNVPGKDKTELKMVNFHGGVGSVWIDEAAERFAELKKDESYATGKKGIYIAIDKTMSPNTSQMANSAYTIYFDERFSDVNALAQAGLLLPITDIVKDETRVGGTLESKLFEQVKGSLMGNDGDITVCRITNIMAGFPIIVRSLIPRSLILRRTMRRINGNILRRNTARRIWRLI